MTSDRKKCPRCGVCWVDKPLSEDLRKLHGKARFMVNVSIFAEAQLSYRCDVCEGDRPPTVWNRGYKPDISPAAPG